jgi:protein phosphatase
MDGKGDDVSMKYKIEDLIVEVDVTKVDIIGDIHGCYDELIGVFKLLGYTFNNEIFIHEEGRKPIFVGDYIDRGMYPEKVLELLMRMHEQHLCYCVLGNHDDKLLRYLKGNPVKLSEEMKYSVKKITCNDEQFTNRVFHFLSSLPVIIRLVKLNAVVVHGSLVTDGNGEAKASSIRHKALYGLVNGKQDDEGRPIRLPWNEDYTGEEVVVYGHEIVERLEWKNNTVDIDLGCFKTGRLGYLQLSENRLGSFEKSIFEC